MPPSTGEGERPPPMALHVWRERETRVEREGDPRVERERETPVWRGRERPPPMAPSTGYNKGERVSGREA